MTDRNKLEMGDPIRLHSIPNATKQGERFSQPDWPVVAQWVDRNVGENHLHDAWTGLARDWLQTLRTSLGNRYDSVESDNFLVLAIDDPRLSRRVLQQSEHARRTILETLPDVALDDGFGKHVVLAFDDTDSYYDYIADFYPDEGEFGLSSGVFLDRGYGHFAMCMAYGDEHDRVIAHELNHNLLRHLPLPLWLNEGVTQVMEDLVVGNSYFVVDHATVRRHRAFWNPETIDQFWSGDSFFASDDGQELSYHLAQVLFRNLMSDYPKKITHFLNAAHYSDAGDQALQQLCKTTLCNRVEQFLGQGAWAPTRAYSDEE